jgi:hypothetical protein
MDQKTSLLIQRQVPEYVREEYPLFLSFLEAYYEFLETKQTGKNNDLTTKLKNLKTVSDIDSSIDEFESQFFNSFGSLIPIDSVADKSFLLKHALPLYQAKGSENSFKFLFRLLFGQEATLSYPKNNILRASDGKWQVDKVIKITSDISSVYTADGNTKEFKLLSKVSKDQTTVYVNDTLVTTGFSVYQDFKKIIFNTNLNTGDRLEVFHSVIDKGILVNRKITGLLSGAYAIVEKDFASVLSNDVIYELYVDDKTLVGEFIVGETLKTDTFIDDVLVDMQIRSVSELKEITVTSSGGSYNVGDPVLVIAPLSQVTPTAIVSKVFKGIIDKVNIINGGAGFQVGSKVYADDYGPPGVDIEVNSVTTVSANSPNTFIVYSDIISDINPGNTTIGNTTYGLSGLTGNVNSVIGQTFSNIAFTNIGEIIGTQINEVQVVFNTGPSFDVEPAKVTVPKRGYTSANSVLYIRSYGALGKFDITTPGTGYQIGDELSFIRVPGTFGFGAAGEVANVAANGAITQLRFIPDKITGTANVRASNVVVVGTSTTFTTDLVVGNKIRINGEDKTVISIASNTSLNVNSGFANTSNSKPVRSYAKHPLGGIGYEQANLPSVIVTSSTGSNANVRVTAILGDGETLTASLGDKKFGGIEKITIIDNGKSLRSPAEIDLTGRGDGLATATSSLVASFEAFPGKFINSDGIISSSYTRLQGLDYYIDYSYVISSSIEFKKYKDVLRGLLHPAGSVAYSEVVRQDDIQTVLVTATSEIVQQPV